MPSGKMGLRTQYFGGGLAMLRGPEQINGFMSVAFHSPTPERCTDHDDG